MLSQLALSVKRCHRLESRKLEAGNSNKEATENSPGRQPLVSTQGDATQATAAYQQAGRQPLVSTQAFGPGLSLRSRCKKRAQSAAVGGTLGGSPHSGRSPHRGRRRWLVFLWLGQEAVAHSVGLNRLFSLSTRGSAWLHPGPDFFAHVVG